MITLKRQSDDGIQTTGIMVVGSSEFCTMERGWHDNANDISCIPLGTYKCTYTRSNRLSQVTGRDYYTYEVLNVPNRAGIRIHSANYGFQLLGCIALGMKFADINQDGQTDLIDSKNAIFAFETLMNKADFELQIT